MKTTEQLISELFIETQLLPPIQTIAILMKSDKIMIETNENYQKRSFRNRYQIGSHQGIKSLSIPLVKGKNNQQLISEVKISYDVFWPDIHWRAIQSSYGKSAYFIFYKDLFADIFYSKCEYLLDLNFRFLDLIRKILGIDWCVERTNKYMTVTDQNQTDLRSAINIKTATEIQIPEYYQVYSSSTGFIPNLSILDLIFHQGPQSFNYLDSVSIFPCLNLIKNTNSV